MSDSLPPANNAPDATVQVGVGPWEGPLPTGDNYDPELLEQGDRRNVVDEFRYWKLEAIVAELDTRRHDFHIAIENWHHDFNIGSVVRTANAFGARAVHIVGRRRWNRRGAMVTDRYQHIEHHPQVSDFAQYAKDEGLAIIGIDNLPGSVSLETFELPKKAVLLFGQESIGITPEAAQSCEAILSIAQFGSTRSMNAGAAAAIAMHAWVRRHVYGQSPTSM